MELETRYIVIKIKDAEKYLMKEQKEQLAAACETITNGRHMEGRGDIKSLVIEKDWPEYIPTLELLSERVDKE